ncbi:hypothetical protein BDV40DRAFT_280322 [Aspergillus tamarii]|uniref:Uncharacterized protein n=1 Tax=Aspergillus tamarii TaxID=41984 RepID=A0A5N6UDN5_ASPTM|nr:hypothetical protein BDV40DRAFT_280322 [Aspergillus tamarii]
MGMLLLVFDGFVDGIPRVFHPIPSKKHQLPAPVAPIKDHFPGPASSSYTSWNRNDEMDSLSSTLGKRDLAPILTKLPLVRVCARPVSPVTMLPVLSSVSQPPALS